ncbi:M12 family metallopeptidase [Jiangella muralis]|uniref:M12 family metallopeptidase n=1 Tax=Jiangella muralis TaxID=702383 RepID=UPI000ABF9EE8|nr:M12 family metallopeptidase [Jiangella muralis]
MPVLSPDLPFDRQRAIIVWRTRWANGTTLRYCFLEQSERLDQQQVVRESFDEWKAIGLGLDFVEVDDPDEAEIRIGFVQGDGSWSYLGRDVLGIAIDQRTMNFGWDLTTQEGRSTARHEIGHSLGLPHEHQNPNAGIIWDEEAVYAFLGRPPNSWDRGKVYQNVLRKLDPREVTGSAWDPASVMHYEFPGGLIRRPEEFRTGIFPPGTVSDVDRQQVRSWYPSQAAVLPVLQPYQSVAMNLAPGEQFDAEIRPAASRKYSIGTFGSADVVMVLFEEVGGELRYLQGDDDSGEARNALIATKLFAGRRYVVRVRLYYTWASGGSALMHW